MDSLQLIHYRNYTETAFDLDQHTIFVGPNGSGKTNVIEALRTLSVTKSYRVNQDREAIQWGKNYCRIILQRPDEKFEYVLSMEDLLGRKVIKHNDVAIPLTDVYGLLPTVLFSPETMHLIDGPPQERRRFLDTLLSQLDHEYLNHLMLYKKLIRERHFVLLRIQSGVGTEDELTYWDEQLVKSGSYIMDARLRLVAQMNELLVTIYPTFNDPNEPSPPKSHAVISYAPTCRSEEFAQTLRAKMQYDIKTTNTSVGPHRDELVFLLDDRNITLFASRGELRRCILAVKLAEASLLKAKKDKPPIVLLDDVFSEFDDIRRKQLKQAVEVYQTVITTTDQTFAEQLGFSNVRMYHLPLKEV